MGDICGVCVCVGKFGSAPAAGGTGAGSLKASEKASGVCRSGERGDSSLNRRGAAVFFYSSHLSGFIIVFFRCSQFLTARKPRKVKSRNLFNHKVKNCEKTQDAGPGALQENESRGFFECAFFIYLSWKADRRPASLVTLVYCTQKSRQRGAH
jgi:hypothetical protein